MVRSNLASELEMAGGKPFAVRTKLAVCLPGELEDRETDCLAVVSSGS